MVKHCVLSLLLVLLNCEWSLARAEEPLEDIMSAAFRLTNNERSGTCFLVRTNGVDETPPRIALVTAAHVLDQMGGEAEWIARIESDGQIVRRPIKLKLREGDKPLWKRHIELDVAALPVELPERAAVKPFLLKQIADELRVKDRQVRVGQEAWIPCYPAKLEANEGGWPVLRRGSIASHPLFPAKSAKTMLLDYTAFGGDSGAPVVVLHDDKPLVVGLVLGMHRQTDRSVLPFEERTTHTPLGLSIVVQASFVRETIELLKD